MNTWPDGGYTPFRNEKNSNWEGAFRVPALIRWPGRVQPGSVSNRIISGLDWFPTLLAAAGDAGVKDRLLAGWRTYKVHLDGFDQLPYLTGQQGDSARKDFFYFNDDGQLVAVRYENWKLVFCEQRAEGTLQIWREPFTCLWAPKMFNLRMVPTSGRTSRQTPTTSGCSATRSWRCRRRWSSRGSSRRSRSSRRGRGRRASASTRSWSRYRSRRATEFQR
jgi:Sulfatase